MKKVGIAREGTSSFVGRKILRIMKISVFLLTVCLAQLSAIGGYGQKATLSVKMEKTTIGEVLEIIQEKTEFKIAFSSEYVDLDRNVNVDYEKEPLDNVLKDLFEDTNVGFKVLDKQIVLFDVTVIQQAEKFAIKGIVTDNSGQPLPGVTVLLKGTSVGTITDINGKYALTDIPADAVLLFSFIGMQSQEVQVASRSVINITLLDEALGLDEVVVIGYGTQKKVNLTSAVQMVDSKDLENRPVKSVTEMLSASVPGLNITTKSGAPNAESSLNIRGFTGFNASGSPLILVDGVPQDIDLVNANDVESISVLKDAAASAIYGSRAPNGVVLITTKSGKKSQKMQINFSADMIVSSPIGLPETVNSDVNAIFRNNQRYNHLRSPLWSDEAIERMTQYIDGEITTTNIILPSGKYGSVYEYNANNDQFDTAFRDNVFNQKYNVSINGGSEKTTYYASLGYIDNQGVYESPVDWMKRYSALIKVNSDITDWLSVGVSSKYGRQQSERPRIWRNGQNDGNFFDAVGFFPSLPSYDDNGSPNEFSIVPNLSGASGSFNNTNDDVWLTGNFDFKPVKGLSIKGDYTWNTNHQFDNNTSFVFNSWDADGTPKPSRRSPSINDIEERSKNKYYHSLNFVATYKLQVNKHDLTLLAGYNEEENKFNSLYGYNSLFYTNSVPSLSTTYSDSPVVDDVIYSWATQGYFGRVSYNYKETYLLDINMRYDASSKYSPDTRWAFFPSVSAGYNVARENFWPLKDYVSMFKIKGSWGKLGNNTGSNYAYLPTMGTNAQTPVILDGGRLPYVSMPGIISDDLTWTKPRTIGFGVEAAALKNRLKVEYDWFQRTVFDQQGPAQQYSEVLGTTGPKKNNAVSETRGWEMSATWSDRAFNVAGDPIRYSVRAGVSDYIGYVVEYEENETGARSGWTPGQVFGELYGYTWGGIGETPEDFQNTVLWRNGWFYPGDFNFADTNGDGLVNNGQGSYWYSQGDRKLLGYNYPRYKYHIALNASWKGLTLSALFDGVGKQTLYTRRKYVMVSKNFYTKQQAELGGTWNLNNQDAFFPRSYDFNYNQIWERNANDHYAHNMAHLRIKNVNLSYQLPASIVSKLRLRSLAVNISGENLGMVYFKSWANHFDPIQFEEDFGTYPPSRIFSFGVKVGI
ncbi:SusC/RagA family TonB-linked outer membrane protein [Saccharicrinis sp. GN24d3]|uniref:SusC/RagA family TonB-linked outer membrane protein n=1 Tax=Saccharicrinis sp. GN24d3 TaxID=3458416 RepID=UPI004035F8B1